MFGHAVTWCVLLTPQFYKTDNIGTWLRCMRKISSLVTKTLVAKIRSLLWPCTLDERNYSPKGTGVNVQGQGLTLRNWAKTGEIMEECLKKERDPFSCKGACFKSQHIPWAHAKYLQKLDSLLLYKSETNNMLLKYYNYRIEQVCSNLKQGWFWHGHKF